jgi:hypothetical protein
VEPVLSGQPLIITQQVLQVILIMPASWSKTQQVLPWPNFAVITIKKIVYLPLYNLLIVIVIIIVLGSFFAYGLDISSRLEIYGSIFLWNGSSLYSLRKSKISQFIQNNLSAYLNSCKDKHVRIRSRQKKIFISNLVTRNATSFFVIVEKIYVYARDLRYRFDSR